MAARMMEQMRTHNPGWEWTTANAVEAVEKINNSVPAGSDARITSWKARSVTNLLVNIPKKCKELLYQVYREWGWELGWLNEDLMRQSFWRPGYKLPKVSSHWQSVYTVNADNLEKFITALNAWWKVYAPTGSGLQVYQAAKPWKKIVDSDVSLDGMSVGMWKLICVCDVELVGATVQGGLWTR